MSRRVAQSPSSSAGQPIKVSSSVEHSVAMHELWQLGMTPTSLQTVMSSREHRKRRSLSSMAAISSAQSSKILHNGARMRLNASPRLAKLSAFLFVVITISSSLLMLLGIC